ncbi:SDHC, cytochrome b subunit of succinate dehydrogenase [Melanogaster broomeanus]|nr:SDHC, cytochrome b subunit of succinate dehydrogenase [Melanogaster broomeanus]
MISTRAVGLGPAFRRAALAPRSARNHVALRSAIARRGVQTQSLPPAAADEILNTQRLKRPSSPHLTIYQPQLTAILSIGNRIAGAALSVLLYGFSLAYLAAPGTFDSAHVVEFVAGMPEYVKTAGKLVLAAPFTFHSWNGLRHLAWDSGKFLSIKAVYGTGYAVLGATAVSTIYLAFM